MTLTYTTEFAKSIWLPFSGAVETLLVNKNSTIEDFLADKNNWLTETGKKFTQLEMEKHWQIIETQKIRIEKFFRGLPLNSTLKN
jgi:hypothetical protein